jgi:hypothetical protein
MQGRLVDSHAVEVGDDVLAAVDAAGGRALVDASDGSTTVATLAHDGMRYVLRLAAPLYGAHSRVRVRIPR